MPLSRPTLLQLRDRIAADYESRLSGTDARLRRSNVAVQATVQAGTAHGLYGFVQETAKQIIIDTAESDYLERWASIWGITRNAGTFATGLIDLVGTSGSTVPAGTALQRSDGAQFTTTTDCTLSSGAGVASVIAAVAGVDGNTAAASTLVFTSAIAGVNATATVESGGLVAGIDAETDAELLSRLLFQIRNPPQGGSNADYARWAREVPGVTRVWVFNLYLGAGTVGIFFVRDDDDVIIPTTGEVAAVQAYIDQRRPVTAVPSVFAPTPDAIAFTIHLNPDSTAKRIAVAAELADLFTREGQPGGTVPIEHIRDSIGDATGVNRYTLTVPSADVVSAAGHMPQVGTITWV